MAQKLIKRKRNAKSRLAADKGLSALVQNVESAVALNIPQNSFKPGDTVAVHVKIREGDKERVQLFEGVVIGRRGRGASKSFMVRKISHGFGVERVFMERSPKIVKVDVLQPGKVRQAKLYYIRELEGKAARIERDMVTTGPEASEAGTPSTPTKRSS